MSTNDLRELLNDWTEKIVLLFIFSLFVFHILKTLYREFGIGEALKKWRRVRKKRKAN